MTLTKITKLEQSNESSSWLDPYVQKKLPLFIRGEGSNFSFETYIVDYEPLTRGGFSLKLGPTVHYDWIETFTGFTGYHLTADRWILSSYKFKNMGTHFLLETMPPAFISDNRKLDRQVFHPDENVTCQILHPYDKETLLIKSVLDLSASGVSFRGLWHSELFTAGLVIPSLSVFFGTEKYLTAKSQVVHKKPFVRSDNQQFYQVGVRFLEIH